MKKTIVAVIAAITVLSMSTAAWAGSWTKSGNGGSAWMYLQDDGSYMTSSWLKDGNDWYYLDENGKMAVGWLQLDGIWYYLQTDGKMVSGMTTIDGKFEMFDQNGVWQYTVIRSRKNASDQTTGPGVKAQEEPVEEVPPEPEKTPEDLEAEAIAAGILSVITNDSMNKPQKANAIYNWIRANTTYSNNGMFPPQYSEGYAAIYGFTRHRGNCYVYYSMSKYLLALCGMPSLRVVRASDGGHFWNLVDVDGVYYHFDACPRRIAGRWCLVTTAYLQGTSWKSHNYDIAAYPATP